MIRLHHAHGTRSQRVLWLLHEIGCDFDLRVWPFDKTLRGEDFARLNPVGRVPALELDGRVVLESGAMIELLCEGFPEAGLARGPGAPERAAFLQWLHFAESISQHTAALTQQHVVIYEDAQRSPTVMKLEAARLGRCLALIEDRLRSTGGKALLGSGFSAADIACGQAVDMARHFVALDDMPALAGWHAAITQRPAAQKAAPPEGQGLYARDFYPVWAG